MPIDNILPTLDLKPLDYNPFLDGTVVYDNTGGVLVPRSASSSVAPLGANPLLEARPSTASTQQLIDSAQRLPNVTVKPNAASLRGYQNAFGGLNTEALGRDLDNLSDGELDDFINGLTAQGSKSAAEASAVASRQTAQQLLRRGSQFAGALGLAVDAYNVTDAIIDPTNHPADEIGDVVGSILGGALGAGLGPVGALGGSLVGGWIGRQLGNMLQGGGARATVQTPGTPRFTGGQGVGVRYHVYADTDIKVFSDGRLIYEGSHAVQGIGVGPLSMQDASGDTQIGEGLVDGIGNSVGFVYAIAGLPPNPSGSYARLINIRVVRLDGEPDLDGDPATPTIPRTTAPDYLPTRPDRLLGPLPDRLPDWPFPDGLRLTDPQGEALPTPDGEPLLEPGDDLPLEPPVGHLDDPPVPDDLPVPRLEEDDLWEPVDPNPPVSCCELNAIDLSSILAALQSIQSEFRAAGFETFNMPDCDDGSPYLLPWHGSGLTGLYDALEVLTEATNRVWAQVKCPPETTAAVPMVWETKVQEHPQLIVLWGPIKGGSSRWSMHIPHPKKSIGQTYSFNFPVYTKGPVRGTLVLSDNSRVVVNASSEAECKKILSYARSLIEPSYLETSRQVFTKGSTGMAVKPVKAVYLKAFAGHRNQAPLWVRQL